VAITGIAADTNKLLNVRKVHQDVGSSYCWVCTAVSLGQYKKPSIILDEKQIAIKYVGNLTTGGDTGKIGMILSMEYNYIASRTNGDPTFSTIKSNINNNNPMITRVGYTGGWSGGHSILINGYSDSSSNYVNAMDPLTGTYRVLDTTSTSNTGHLVYISPSGKSATATEWLI
jgi:hypothetical protein